MTYKDVFVYVAFGIAAIFIASAVFLKIKQLKHNWQKYKTKRAIFELRRELEEMELGQERTKHFEEKNKKYMTEREQKIRLIAYHKWEAAGCPHGKDQEFWKQAEGEYFRQQALEHWVKARKVQDEQILLIEV